MTEQSAVSNQPKQLTKAQRVGIANKAVEIIASHGRKFFSLAAEGRQVENNRISRFELHDNGRIWFIDKYSQKPIYVMWRRSHWRGFSEGGTLQDLICALADWIVGKKEQFPIKHFGPWPQIVCDGDLWGYGPEMEIVRAAIKQLVGA
jgi:hypothetical protein